MVVGGQTQYLAQVQGMPQAIQKKLKRQIRDFLWDQKPYSPVNADTLYVPIEEGGKNVLDIQARNQAIKAMMIKEYLSFRNNRPIWAAFADRIFAICATAADAGIDPDLRRNMLLQSWSSSKSAKLKMSRDLRDILDGIKAMGVRLEGIAFVRNILQHMLLYYHAEASPKIRQLMHAETVTCLQDRHKIWSVSDTELMAMNLEKPAHKNNKRCRCDDCWKAHNTEGCHNPNACFKRARLLLDQLPLKWDPRGEKSEDFEHFEMGEVIGDPKTEEGATFNNAITIQGNLRDIFRIFTEGETTNKLPRTCCKPTQGARIVIATDSLHKQWRG
jgi:hypothetical protein